MDNEDQTNETPRVSPPRVATSVRHETSTYPVPSYPLARHSQRLSIPDRIGDHAEDPVKTFPPGRVCRALGCDTRLSIYNGGIFCAQHQPLRA
jgi:hypothetical protein